jgi:hypothetical protein
MSDFAAVSLGLTHIPVKGRLGQEIEAREVGQLTTLLSVGRQGSASSQLRSALTADRIRQLVSLKRPGRACGVNEVVGRGHG